MMANQSWIQLFIAALGGGFTVKILDIAYSEFRQRRSQTETATAFVDTHLEPLLKSADELTGKLRAAAERDFKGIYNKSLEEKFDNEFVGLVFLFGMFWAQIERIRKDGMSVAMAKDRRGALLQQFIDCLESRRVRILDRITQRAAGEICINNGTVLTFVEFMAEFESNTDFKKWISPLSKFLSRTNHTYERQRLLQYGAVIHALIDTLDAKHLVTRERPSWPNKLSKRSWRSLNYRVFGVYLKDVSNKQKYLGPPKKERPQIFG